MTTGRINQVTTVLCVCGVFWDQLKKKVGPHPLYTKHHKTTHTKHYNTHTHTHTHYTRKTPHVVFFCVISVCMCERVCVCVCVGLGIEFLFFFSQKTAQQSVCCVVFVCVQVPLWDL